MQELLVMPQSGRYTRKPKHWFNLSVRPFQIQPCVIAPVLPGETMDSCWMEARVITDPLLSPIIGWRTQYHAFYVKIRDLNERDSLDDLFTNPSASVSALNSAADVPTYHKGGSPNFTKMCLQRVVETFYRDEGEVWNADVIDTLPVAQIQTQMWMDSLTDTTVIPDGGALGVSGTTTGEQLDKLMDAYELLRAAGYTTLNFNDYLQTAGVKLSRGFDHVPELLYSWSEFTYPSNTVNPADGSPTSAASWVFKKSERDRKAFKEPGFVFVTQVIRPKVYFAQQYGSMSHYLDQGLSWLLPLMHDNPESSLREFTGAAAGNGPLSNGTRGPTNGYWVDMRDLFNYGDQFSNQALAAAANAIALPDNALKRKYATATMVDTLFKSGAANKIRTDGFVSLSVKSPEAGRDYTGGHQARG